MFAHRLEAERLASQLLVLEERVASPVHRPQRCNVGRLNGELCSEVTPQIGRHDTKSVEWATAHAEKPDLQRKAEFERWGPPLLDEPSLSCGEREERFELELADLAWQLTHAQEL